MSMTMATVMTTTPTTRMVAMAKITMGKYDYVNVDAIEDDDDDRTMMMR